MKKKILILINSDTYVRNYLETEAFKKIVKKFNCFFIANSNEVLNKKRLSKKLKKKFLGYIDYSKNDFKMFQKYLYRNFLLNNENSRTIDYLKKKILRPKFYWQGDKWYDLVLKFPSRLFSFLKKNLEFLIFKIINKNIFLKIPDNKIIEICDKIKPDLFIFPLQDAHIASFDLLQINKKNKTLGLIDNWDNLSSRPTHQLKPKYISVWGKQTKEHAIKFQKFNKQNIFVIGTPRFSEYFKKRNIKLKSNFKFKYFLFLESFNNYDNFFVLKKLDNFIEKNKKFKNYKILYRPHPWQKKNRSILIENEFKNLIIDPQLKKKYLSLKFSSSFQPDIKYYSSLIKNAEVVITGPTSMLIEATIFYKKILLLAYKSKSSTPYSEELKNFEHLKGIENLKNIKTVNIESDFINKLMKTLDLNIDKSKVDKLRNFYLDYSGQKYSDKLFKVTNKIIND